MIDWIDYLKINENYNGDDINKNCIKFVFLWIKYNNYYNKHYTKEKNTKYKYERERAKALNLKIVRDRYDLLKEQFLDSFVDLPNNKSFRTYIMNLKSNHQIEFNINHSCLADFLETVYQIRCNLFHGDKLSREYDAKIISWAYESLNDLLTGTIF